MREPTYRISSEKGWRSIAKEMALLLSKKQKIIALKGDLGAGKTTFVRYLMDVLLSKDDVSSPSFSIINEYSTQSGVVYHMDLYRLDQIEQLMEIGFEEYIYSGAICIIEWPELAFPIIKDNCILMEISLDEEYQRIIYID